MTTASNSSTTFVRSFLDSLAHCKESIAPDYVNPQDSRPAKPYPLSIPVVEPKTRLPLARAETSTGQGFQITVKNLKPGVGLESGSLSLTIRPLDSIQQVKEAIASASSKTLGADNIRLVLKGKALLDTKLVKEYDTLTSGSLIHLAQKTAPASQAAPSARNDPMETDSAQTIHAPTPVNVAKIPHPLEIPNSGGQDGISPLQPSPNLSHSPSIGKRQLHARTPSITITPTATDPSQMHPHLASTGRAGSPTSPITSVDVSENAAFPAMPFVAGKRATILASSTFWTGLRNYIQEELKKEYEKKLLSKAQAEAALVSSVPGAAGVAASPGSQASVDTTLTESPSFGFGTPGGNGHHRRNSSSASGTASPSSERTQIQIDRVWETMFLACKPLLTPSEIAKIRDDMNQMEEQTIGRQ